MLLWSMKNYCDMLEVMMKYDPEIVEAIASLESRETWGAVTISDSPITYKKGR